MSTHHPSPGVQILESEIKRLTKILTSLRRDVDMLKGEKSRKARLPVPKQSSSPENEKAKKKKRRRYSNRTKNKALQFIAENPGARAAEILPKVQEQDKKVSLGILRSWLSNWTMQGKLERILQSERCPCRKEQRGSTLRVATAKVRRKT